MPSSHAQLSPQRLICNPNRAQLPHLADILVSRCHRLPLVMVSTGNLLRGASTMTDTTKVEPDTEKVPCATCGTTEHTTLGHMDGGTPMTTNGHMDGGAPPKG